MLFFRNCNAFILGNESDIAVSLKFINHTLFQPFPKVCPSLPLLAARPGLHTSVDGY